jgi:hypothetical protein
MVCTVKVQNRNKTDLGIEFTNDTTADKTFGMPAGKNDWGEMVTVSGCGDDYAVYLYDHNPINRDRAQHAYVFQDGSWWLHRLRGNTSAAEIVRVTKPDRVVGYQNIHYLSHYGIRNGTHELFKSSYEINPGARVNHADLCPGGGEVIPLSMNNEYGGVQSYIHRFACSYPKTESAIRLAENGTSGKPTRPVYDDMINRLCAKKENLGFGLPDNTICAEHSAGVNLAKNYCLEGENMVTNKTVCNKEKLPGRSATYTDILKTYCARGANIKSTLCSELSKDEKGTTSAYETLWRNYCDRTPSDSWCACYNAVKDAASGFCGSNPTAAGCVKVKQSFGKLVEKTPDDQKAVWSGMQPCFGGVCSSSNTFKPEGYNASCDKSVNVCIQDFRVEGLRDSQINATCEINNERGDGGGGGSQPSVNTPSSDPSAPPSSDPSAPPSSDSSAPAKDNTTMYVGIGIAVVVLVLILLLSGGGGGGGRNYNNYNNY